MGTPPPRGPSTAPPQAGPDGKGVGAPQLSLSALRADCARPDPESLTGAGGCLRICPPLWSPHPPGGSCSVSSLCEPDRGAGGETPYPLAQPASVMQPVRRSQGAGALIRAVHASATSGFQRPGLLVEWHHTDEDELLGRSSMPLKGGPVSLRRSRTGCRRKRWWPGRPRPEHSTRSPWPPNSQVAP
jgi:hypothetical protein